MGSDVQTTAVSGRLPAKKGENCGNDKFIHKLNLCSKNGKIMQPIAGEPIMERPASRGRMGDRGRLDASDDDDEEVSRAESFHSRRSHTTTGGTGHSRHNSSNCINVYSSYTTDPLQTASGQEIDPGGPPNVRRSASGVFRYPTGEDSENQFSDQLYLLENGCNRHGHAMPEY